MTDTKQRRLHNKEEKEEEAASVKDKLFSIKHTKKDRSEEAEHTCI